MELKRVITAFFSPTGGTKKVAMALQDGFLSGIDGLHPKVQSYNYLTPESRQNKCPEFSASDLLVFCYPVYFNRIPWAVLEWPNLKGNNASALVVSVYGNRRIGDAEREAMAFLQDHGFKIIGAIEAVAEHSQDRAIAAGRPNLEDKAQLAAMARTILEKYQRCIEVSAEWEEPSIDRTTPLREKGHGAGVPAPLNPEVCEHCGRCARVCPMGIINPLTSLVDPADYDKCMACRACMTACRRGTRGFSPEVDKAIAEKMMAMRALTQTPMPNVLKI